MIGVDISDNGDEAVLIVGRKMPGQKVTQIINAFSGDEAKWMYERLVNTPERNVVTDEFKK